MVGEIYLATIQVTDASSSKVRPILLLKKNSFNDVLYMPLTSNTEVKGILINNDNLQNGYLPKMSIVVYEKIGVIAGNLLLKKIGTLDEITFQQVIGEMIKFLQI